MKNTIILLAAFILLGGVSYWLVNKEDKPLTSIKSGDRDFAVKDIDQVAKIFMADRSGNKNTLIRNGKSWQINNKYKVKPDALAALLTTIQNMEMSYIPPKSAIPNIVKVLASSGIKVELYDKENQILKAYYVGGMTNKEDGTYMIMEGAEQPYVMHLPTMYGGLRARYLMNEESWRDLHVFNREPEEIDFISVEYPKQKNKSFNLERKNKEFMVTPFHNTTPKITRPYKKGSAESYLIGYEKFNAENLLNNYKHRDSISGLIPFAIVTLRDNKGDTQIARFHPMRPIGDDGLPLTDDKVAQSTAVERYHVNHNRGDFYLVQQRNFGRAFWSYESFYEE